MQPYLFSIELFHDDRNYWQAFHRNLRAFGKSSFRLFRLGNQYKRFSENFTAEDFQNACAHLNPDAMQRAQDMAREYGAGSIALVDQRYLTGLPKTRSPVRPSQLFLCGWPDIRPSPSQIKAAERYFGCPVTGFMDAELRVTPVAAAFEAQDPSTPSDTTAFGEICTALLPTIGTDCAQATAAKAERKHIMFVTSNGVGLGHLSRCLSAARRLDNTRYTASFASISRGVPLVQQFGFEFDYIAGPAPELADGYDWDGHLFQDLTRHADRTGADTLVFDGNFPYAGLRHFLNTGHVKNAVWIRRALWRREYNLPLEDLEKPFSLVVEPEDVAAHFDYGATRVRQPYVAPLPSVTLLDADGLKTKAAARAELGLSDTPLIGVLQIGALSNNRNGEITTQLIAALRDQAAHMETALELVWVANPIADPSLADEAKAMGLTVVSRFPLQDVARAFDFAILGGGYNSVHETLQSHVPAVFIPNEGGMMDAQRLRVDWLAQCGAAEVLRAHEYRRVNAVAQALLSTEARARMRSALEDFEFENGAMEMAKLIQATACSL